MTPVGPRHVRRVARTMMKRVEPAMRGDLAGDVLRPPPPPSPGLAEAIGVALDAARTRARVLLAGSDPAPEVALHHVVHAATGVELLGRTGMSDVDWSRAIDCLAGLTRLDIWFAQIDAGDGTQVGLCLDAWRRILEGGAARAEVIVTWTFPGPDGET